jgi:hypothetical protein
MVGSAVWRQRGPAAADGHTAVLTGADVAALRRVVEDPIGGADGLDRQTALDVLTELEAHRARRRRVTSYAVCPACGNGFDIGLRRRPQPLRREPPPPHPDPLGAAVTPAGAESVARALATALARGNRRLNGPDAFWVGVGQTVLWPLLWLGAVTGADMAEVGTWAHPDAVDATLARASDGLEALAGTAEVELVREHWAYVRDCRPAGLRIGFTNALAMIRHWELERDRARAYRVRHPAGNSERIELREESGT